jgi:hypothetical protein
VDVDVVVFENGMYDAMVLSGEYALSHDDLTGSLSPDSSSRVASGRRILVSGTP